MKPLYILLLLLVAFAFNFTHRDGWKNSQWPGDEPTYIETSYSYYSGVSSSLFPAGQITWSPGYVQLMSPFIGVLGKETGYKIWRFILFAGVSLLVYAAFSQMFGSAWLGAVLALYSQMFNIPYMAPSLQSLACLIYLICFLLLTAKTRFLGLTLGILMNGIFVSGTVGFVFFCFGALSFIFYPRVFVSRRFLIQFLSCAALFGVNLYHCNFDIRDYPQEAFIRGNVGFYHNLAHLIINTGRSAPYFKPGDDEPKENNPDEFHRQQKAKDRYFLDKYGEKFADIRVRRHDERWPKLFLDWPWMMKKDPELMKEHTQEIFRALKESLWYSFEIILPFGDYNINTLSPKRGMYVVPLMFVLLLPHLIGLARRKPIDAPAWPSRLQLLFLLSCLATLIPLTLVKPLIIYFPPLIPSYLMLVALLTVFFISGVRKLFPSSR